eukprot:CAMPEP_0182835168 /NCGR_PEP_ID=MMETSP0006_2-20121128/21348_1 /TAXON_ID=97485 /ORGANISM="Prymnesium parvum, Strain Texoma1" /LENGTH=193 /DNA_ID=CAMNT_0024963551 /DNA_START=223 /DNA_END=800 /DNA_ORIENTATION=-
MPIPKHLVARTGQLVVQLERTQRLVTQQIRSELRARHVEDDHVCLGDHDAWLRNVPWSTESPPNVSRGSIVSSRISRSLSPGAAVRVRVTAAPSLSQDAQPLRRLSLREDHLAALVAPRLERGDEARELFCWERREHWDTLHEADDLRSFVGVRLCEKTVRELKEASEAVGDEAVVCGGGGLRQETRAAELVG